MHLPRGLPVLVYALYRWERVKAIRTATIMVLTANANNSNEISTASAASSLRDFAHATVAAVMAVTREKLKPPLLVSVSSLPSRIGQIRPCLESLLAGSILPDKILVVLPISSIRERSRYVLPDFLDNSGFCRGIVEVVRTQRDWGPGTKLLGALGALHDPCVLVIADDDVKYKPSFLAGLYAAQTEDHRASFSFYTYRSNGLTIGQGCDGFSFWPPNLAGIGAFAERYITGTDLFFHDDLWISFYLKMHGIAVKSLAGKLVSGLIYERLHDINSLNKLDGPLRRGRLDREGTRRLLKEVPMPTTRRMQMRVERAYDRYVGRQFRSLQRKLGGALHRS